MKKNIVIVILIVLCGLFAIFSKVKASEASGERARAQAAQTESEKLRDQAVQLQKNALDEATNARIAETKALVLAEQLRNCQSK
jgi:hypothetical protein